MKKLILIAAMLLAAVFMLDGCGTENAAPAAGGNTAGEESVTAIVLGGTGAEIRGGGARAEGGTVLISAVGSYSVSGSLDAGQLVVDTGDEAMNVTLILDGASITNPEGAALWIRQAKNVTLKLRGENLLVSGTQADLDAFDGLAEGAALYSEDDVKIEGGGTLEVRGYVNNGVTCKDDLEMSGGTVTILAANNGLRASESVTLTGGTLNISAGNDGVKTTSDKKDGKGYIEISGGTLSVGDTRGDGISAQTQLHISGGRVSVSVSGDAALGSSKALKAAGDIEITGGTVLAQSETDDGVHCDGSLAVTGGTLSVTAGGDGIQSGVRGGGAGDVAIRGGSVSVFALKQAVQAEGAFTLSGCSFLALSDSKKQSAPDSSGVPYILCAVKGSAGDLLSVGAPGDEGNWSDVDVVESDSGGPLIQAPFDYKSLLYAASGLPVGESVEVFNGRTSVRTIVQ